MRAQIVAVMMGALIRWCQSPLYYNVGIYLDMHAGMRTSDQHCFDRVYITFAYKFVMMIAALDGPITLSSYLNPSSVAGLDLQIDAVRSSITLTLKDLVGEATDSELPLTLIQLIVSFLYSP
jgi:hypothetical protein